jgi:hypothetical protein
MLRRFSTAMLTAVLVMSFWSAFADGVRADDINPNRFFHYPYTYFPHSYWPAQGPKYPEPPGAPYMRPPAYMAYPAFKEPHWRYELDQPQTYYRGFHFWLDQF